jgi:hypothetical protein
MAFACFSPVFGCFCIKNRVLSITLSSAALLRYQLGMFYFFSLSMSFVFTSSMIPLIILSLCCSSMSSVDSNGSMMRAESVASVVDVAPRKTMSSSSGCAGSACGALDKASASECSFPGLCLMLKLYEFSSSAHLVLFPLASLFVSTVLQLSRGLWSVSTVNFLNLR